MLGSLGSHTTRVLINNVVWKTPWLPCFFVFFLTWLLSKEMFSSCHEGGTKKHFEPQAFGFRSPIFCHWAIDTLRWSKILLSWYVTCVPQFACVQQCRKLWVSKTEYERWCILSAVMKWRKTLKMRVHAAVHLSSNSRTEASKAPGYLETRRGGWTNPTRWARGTCQTCRTSKTQETCWSGVHVWWCGPIWRQQITAIFSGGRQITCTCKTKR